MHGFLYDVGKVLAPVALALLAYIAAQLTRLLQPKRVAPAKEIGATHKEDTEITLILDRARWRLGPHAQRTYLTRLHNGESFLGDACILRKSRTHERVRPGVAYQAEDYRGVLVSTLAEEMALVIADGPSFTLVSTLPRCKFRWLCEQGGVEAVARCAVKKGNRIVGFVGADFDAPEKPADIESLCRDAYQIGNILAGYK